ncbi:hypothetical protein [Nonomuraea sp. NPDC050643]|uniref:hypothetical protein n=1 Tax=Nonomuraea sp. NPDC050643 TaxID=3155660 RepID=UPI00340D3733
MRKPKASQEATTTLPARSVRVGHRYVSSPTGGRARQRNGSWPAVTKASFLQKGEDDQPTVYIETSDKPGWTYCLSPDEQVTVVSS